MTVVCLVNICLAYQEIKTGRSVPNQLVHIEWTGDSLERQALSIKALLALTANENLATRSIENAV
jgi:hypothetical protein